MLSLLDNNLADIIETFSSTSSYLDNLLDIDFPYYEQMVCQIYLIRQKSFILRPLIGFGLFGILGQVCYLIVSIPDLCTLTHFVDSH